MNEFELQEFNALFGKGRTQIEVDELKNGCFGAHWIILARSGLACIVLNQNADVFRAFREVDVQAHEREPDRLFWGLADLHARFFRGSTAFFHIAVPAGGHDVVPGLFAALYDRDHVIHGQIGSWGSSPAVLAGVIVSQEDIIAREADDVFPCPVVGEFDEPDDKRHSDRDRDGAYFAIRTLDHFNFS